MEFLSLTHFFLCFWLYCKLMLKNLFLSYSFKHYFFIFFGRVFFKNSATFSQMIFVLTNLCLLLVFITLLSRISFFFGFQSNPWSKTIVLVFFKNLLRFQLKLRIWHKSTEKYEILENTKVGRKISLDLEVSALFPAKVEIFHKNVNIILKQW